MPSPYYLQEGANASKKEGGEWTRRFLPKECKMVVECCLNRYMEKRNEGLDVSHTDFIQFAEWMVKFERGVSLQR
ncbi:aminoglycoside adenylyltransferase domain-containing protein [Bacillus sp. SA1-12]|uniref:aminoglycoside adenylyltransferase domain-containing protein n=1 Tax=Bacillus sp. SA1-12 TaxID=1455638 RepID=UPI000A07C219